MIAVEELVVRVAGLDRGMLTHWVENRWVLPEIQDGTWLFSDLDVARVELIVEIRRDFAVDDEALPLILGLLDQVYSLRRQMRRLCAAMECQPDEVREAIERALPPAAGRS